MRWFTETPCAKEDRLFKWSLWFAWKPIKLNSSDKDAWVWLSLVERRMTRSQLTPLSPFLHRHTWWCEYREIEREEEAK